MNRRLFLRYGLEAGLVAGAVCAFGSFGTRKPVVRPPGAVEETEFRSRCLHCGACIVECPTKALRLLDLGLDFSAIGTPVLEAVRGGCEAWKNNCRRCAEICPTAALLPEKVGKAPLAWVRMHPVEKCDNCMICFQRCPIPGALLFPNPDGPPFTREQDIPTALKLRNAPQKPYFNPDLCVGCGLCVAHCPPRVLTLQALESKP